MKNLSNKLILLLAVLSLFGVGCSNKSNSNSSNDVIIDGEAVTPPDGLDGNISSNTVAFHPVSDYEMNSYVGTRPLNAPRDYKLQVDLVKKGTRYAGNIKISYIDRNNNGYEQRYEGNFISCFTSNCKNPSYPSYGTSRDDGESEIKYNYWFTRGGKKVFSGFFQDSYGSIVLVIDNVVNQGDGQGVSTVSGQIWYMNFAQSFAYQSDLRACWFIYAGPYDCRSNAVMKKTSVYPTDGGYRKLGDFYNLTFSN